MSRMAAHDARKNFSDTLNRVTYRRERIIIHRRGKDSAVLIPMEDMLLIEAMEDHIDLEDAQAALNEPGENIPYDEVKKRLGL